MPYFNKPYLIIGFLFLLLVGMSVEAQVIEVLDEEEGFPIDKVLVYNESQTLSLSTDIFGVVDISAFETTDILTFQHLAYKEFSISKKDIKDINNTVYLEQDTEHIDEVVLTASRGEEKRSRIAEHIEVIGAKRIEELSPQTSADLLQRTPGVKIQKSQFGGGSPVLRGMEANRVLLVVDGVRMNNAIYRKGHIQNSITVSPNLLERTEVLFGPSSIIYGSDALGGVIHYYTKKPRISEDPLHHSSFFSRYSSVNNEKSASYTYEYGSKKWASLTAISVSKFEDLKMGKNRTHGFDNWGLVPYYSENSPSNYHDTQSRSANPNCQYNTGFSQIDLLQKFVFPLTAKTDLNVNIQYSNSTNVPRFDKLNEYDEGTLKYAEWYYGPQKRLLLASQLNLSPGYSWLDNGVISLAFQNIDESRITRKFEDLTKFFGYENVKVYSLNGDFHLPLTQDGKRILSYGFETSYNDVASEAFSQELIIEDTTITGLSDAVVSASRYPDAGSRYSNFALYTNYRLDHSEKGTLNVGVRFTNTLLKAEWKENPFVEVDRKAISIRNAAFSGTLGYVYKAGTNWRISSVLSSGFRSPNIDDIGKIREKRGKVSVPNITLQPEMAYNAEIGLMRFFNQRRTKLGFITYITLLHNYITRDYFHLKGESTIEYNGETARVVANVNKGNAVIKGFTASVQTKLTSHLKINSSVTYTKGKALDGIEPLSSIPPLFGDVAVLYRYKKFRFGGNFRFNSKKSSKDYNMTEGIDNIEETPLIDETAESDVDKYYGTPAWQTIGLSARYKLSQYATLRFRLDNLFDVHYKEFASGVSAPGRNISISINTNF